MRTVAVIVLMLLAQESQVRLRAGQPFLQRVFVLIENPLEISQKWFRGTVNEISAITIVTDAPDGSILNDVVKGGRRIRKDVFNTSLDGVKASFSAGPVQ